MDIKEKIIIEFWRDFRSRLQWELNTNKITKQEFDNKIIELENLVESRLKENRDFEINRPIRIQEYIIDELHKKALINTLFIIIIFILFITIYKLIN